MGAVKAGLSTLGDFIVRSPKSLTMLLHDLPFVKSPLPVKAPDPVPAFINRFTGIIGIAMVVQPLSALTHCECACGSIPRARLLRVRGLAASSRPFIIKT